MNEYFCLMLRAFLNNIANVNVQVLGHPDLSGVGFGVFIHSMSLVGCSDLTFL